MLKFNLLIMFGPILTPVANINRSITKSYYRNSVGAVLCYDITCRSSFEKIPNWMVEAKKHIDPIDPQFLLVGCKGDLDGCRQVSTEEGAACAKALGIYFLETSARTGKNVEEAFQTVTQEIYNRISSGEYKVDDVRKIKLQPMPVTIYPRKL